MSMNDKRYKWNYFIRSPMEQMLVTLDLSVKSLLYKYLIVNNYPTALKRQDQS